VTGQAGKWGLLTHTEELVTIHKYFLKNDSEEAREKEERNKIKVKKILF
jgi:hypothetical protein